ncbi:hypothetical protein G6F62_004029 [Rhizopus arrhizus]|nr:hypothetical protein G6F24_001707 [Rhizopus arrhizus]KAG0795522.1 hypothetical protein G6F21_002042 [Rhizopus arrhizus]KAG0799410.1 hypothetical protein G6F22_003255 [Rhizopus arrhizus]KAG0809879.1 hypothetical protein G6F20_008420 [Rhizopus arrhizus]KAG0832063.1 hypothetical protein G6F18_007389 [Rhizopus arrhizus]
MSLKNDRSFYKKTKSNAIVKLVREQYVRDDIPCLSESCASSCENNGHQALLSSSSDHYIIPDISVIMRYLEILEQEEITGIICSQTVIMNLQQHDKMKIYRKLRQIINDSRRKSIVFYNEIFTETKVHRFPQEPSSDRDWRALCELAAWYQRHLSKKIILLTEQKDKFTPSDSIVVMSTKEYIQTYWSQHTLLNDLVQGLADVVLEEDEFGKIKFSSKQRTNEAAVSGYVEYKSIEDLEVGIKSGRYFSGTLRCKKDHRDQAYISANDGRNILISGNDHRNRAVHGDAVVVELLSENNWSHLTNDIAFESNNAEDEYERDYVTNASQPSGRVIGILNRNWRSYVATVQEDEVGGSIHLAIPLDPVIPKIRIRYNNVKLIENQRIVVRIDNWPVSSQYPNGHFVRSLGPIHELDTEISAILVEHDISVSQASQGFSEASLREMPIDSPESPWQPEKEEIDKRRDLRDLIVFSIDPPNCQDIDDAMSIKELSNGHVELGVHIADVSYFVKENFITDLEARSRGTTVYLADRRFDMLPSVLSERVCSLRHRVDRYAVSVIWTMDEKYNILDTWFGRTIIHSSCEMEYEQAQQLLNGKQVASGLDASLCKKLKPRIEKLAQVLRVIRDSMEIHGLVAEAMILANASVGKRIYDGFKDAAILRHHPPPSPRQFEKLVKAAESKGFLVDFSSNRALSQSLQKIAEACQDDVEIVKLLKTMATMAMNEAGYISSGHFSVDQYFHYGLALEFYTHFTSPIRRYADIVAHRQLLACVQDSVDISSSLMYKDSAITDICDNLNRKSRESKFAQRDSTELFQSLYVLQKTFDGEPLIEKGIISEIRSNGFYVFVPRLGLKGPVYLKERDGTPSVPLSLISGNKGEEKEEKTIPDCSIEVNMPTSISVVSCNLPHPIDFNLFDHVRVSLKLRKSHAHRHLVYMSLVDMDYTEVKRTQMTRMSNTEMMESIHLSEKKGQEKSSKKKKKSNQSSMYDVLEKFRKLSITQTTSLKLVE